MASKKRKTLKTYFQTGKIPTQEQYADLIDSKLNIVDTDSQTIASGLTINGDVDINGTLEANSINTGLGDFEIGQNLRTTDSVTFSSIFASGSNGHITASGTISASSEIISNKYRFTSANSEDYIGLISNAINIKSNVGIVKISGNITSSNNISSSGIVTAEGLVISDDASITDTLTVGTITNVSITHVTASGNISASGQLVVNDIISDNTITSTTGNLNLLTGNISLINGHITASGNISGSTTSTASFGSLKIDGSSIDFTNLPTSDPGIVGRLYNSASFIKISAG